MMQRIMNSNSTAALFVNCQTRMILISRMFSIRKRNEQELALAEEHYL